MFGYIKPFRPELKIREFDEYQAVYCGLCHQLGHSFSFVARLTLSYDFAFLAAFLMSLEGNEICPSYEKCKCIAHPIKSRNCCKSCEALSFSANCAAVLTYYKLKDDLKDHGILKKIRAIVLLPFAKSWRKKTILSPKFSEIDEKANEMMQTQENLEKELCQIPDKAAEPTAKFLSFILSSYSNENNKIILERIGYLIGRYIYLCDALDDIDNDKKQKNYNPFLFSDENAMEIAKQSLFLTTSELGDDIDLMNLGVYKGIIENTVKLGLRNEVLRILDKKGGKSDAAKSL